MKLFLSLVLLFSSVFGSKIKSFSHPSFSKASHSAVFRRWRKHFGKNYGSSKLESKKFVTFLENYRFVSHVNSQNLTYKLSLNEFADMTPREFKLYIHGNEESCLKQNTVKKASDFYDPKKARITVPSEIDWTTKGVVTAVKNQKQCGSCWAFSTTGSVESRVAIATGKLTPLSEQELVDCSTSYGNHGCQGGLMDYGFKYVKDKGGLCSEEEYPYKAKNGVCESSRCTERYDAITGYVDVSRESESSLQAAVASGPVSIAIEADQRVFQLYHSGVLQAACGTKLDHGVLVVGYGAENGVSFWKVKNSWGASWGEEGYVKLCRDCHENGRQGECGILDQASYPTA